MDYLKAMDAQKQKSVLQKYEKEHHWQNIKKDTK